MNKVELEAKVDALMDEINFMKMFFEAVRNASYLGPRDMGRHQELGALGLTSVSLLPLWYYSHFITL